MDFKLPVLAPSILAADYTQLGSQIGICNKAGVHWIHCDIMDGHFVPNISFGPAVVAAADESTDALLDVHLMIEDPDKYIEAFADAGADNITVHQEACPHLHRTIQNIHNQGITAGVAINPGTSLHNIEAVLTDVDLVLVMSVNPGFGGQSFIKDTYKRLQRLQQMREEQEAGFMIEVDGGINLKNVDSIGRLSDILVAGSAVFKAKNLEKRIENLTQKLQSCRQDIV